MKDAINPSHYTDHPSGIECIQITEHMDFLIGNAVKYAWRAGLKDNKVQDLLKCHWYIARSIIKCYDELPESEKGNFNESVQKLRVYQNS